MPKVPMYNISGDQVGELELDDRLFAAPVREDLMHQAVLQYLAGQRSGTHKTKGRSEVRGGGRKPWRQKGTGRARQGSIRSPQWKGGGVVFGPQPRDYSQRINKKVRRAALYSALTAKFDEGKLIVLDELSFPEVKTKQVISLMGQFSLEQALIVDSSLQSNTQLSARNLQNVKYTVAQSLNVYELLKHSHIVLTKDAVEKVQEVFA
ncbi:50S ribosomal protein L4 [Alicyclobacillus sp. SO9]|uniref:50S ribosomal protein L4 n=1 Tax=Alicyclobacillus sp. SO9 TaxID=2665646 RepID=UPI0018E8AD7D|nr:50S ribosomal protein L4 [Alicyclobacillus sp. SO9]QQE78531.1 50S ribosomal protein L4 [Alicyclobacillus sp. SO9]